MSQEIRDMLTQQQSQYVWEAYLKHRKHGQSSTGKKNHPITWPPNCVADKNQAPRPSGKAQVVGHNKCCTKKGK